MSLEEFDKAEDSFDKAESVYKVLKIDASPFMNLQKGILYKITERQNWLPSYLMKSFQKTIVKIYLKPKPKLYTN
ncbi:hypothetical protein QWY90_15475 [Flavobacterium paronense]|nr:hypothetical protein [Flavobacterium paronense]MDN3678689.1 hypothetical protein [Flavobacterium paronense]